MSETTVSTETKTFHRETHLTVHRAYWYDQEHGVLHACGPPFECPIKAESHAAYMRRIYPNECYISRPALTWSN